MKKHPLFKVLVLGGASLVTTAPFLWTAGCGEESSDTATPPGKDWPPREGPGYGGSSGCPNPDSGGDADAHSDAAGDADRDASGSDAMSVGDADSGDG